MIIRNLYSLFCGSELQKGRLDSSIPPSEIVEKENTAVIIPRQFKDDVERLCNFRLRNLFLQVRAPPYIC